MGSYTKSAFDTLRKIPELLPVPDFQLEWLLENSEFRSLKEGDLLFEPEMAVDNIYIILEGTIELYLFERGCKRLLVQYQKGGILGYLPFSRVQKSIAFGIATSPVELLSYPKSKIQDLIQYNPELTEELVHVMISRVHHFSSQVLHNEKMLALGRLSAGLTHELNNPITSISRDNAELNRLFLSENLSELVCAYSGLDLEAQPELLKAINTWKHSSRVSGLTPSEIRNLEKDWKDKLKSWGMKNPEEAAEVFTDSGIDSEEIHHWVKKLTPNKVDTWLNWIQFLLQTQALVS
ncbi:MAG TPA: cyclic nucleotide-binding domain-containing protein, partial [Algoriphagus sp.]|nr:cyclic nucleotide-binding domain-containing protein [Algoriphagus sp.]